ncbi:MAG: hypothetical protein GX577_11350 [Leptolinea sp.]|nr:hypothetical protein [Leptolinea sp.]
MLTTSMLGDYHFESDYIDTEFRTDAFAVPGCTAAAITLQPGRLCRPARAFNQQRCDRVRRDAGHLWHRLRLLWAG